MDDNNKIQAAEGTDYPPVASLLTCLTFDQCHHADNQDSDFD